MTTPTAKIWGSTEPLITTPMFEMHRLVVKPRHRCSFHVHRFKHNGFYVVSGRLLIDQAERDHTPVETRTLSPGESFTIAPGVHHQFRTERAGCVCLEMYYTEPLSEDIVRRNVGGAT